MKEFIEIQVMFVSTEKIDKFGNFKASCRDTAHFIPLDQKETAEMLKQNYNPSLGQYPYYVTRSGRFDVSPFGKPAQIGPRTNEEEESDDEDEVQDIIAATQHNSTQKAKAPANFDDTVDIDSEDELVDILSQSTI
jgi:hypothetical protein